MTVDQITPESRHVIGASGPYAITFPYAAGELALFVQQQGARVAVPEAGLIISPAASEVGGSAWIDASFAAAHVGWQLIIERVSQQEQGWLGLANSRERGLEVALDRLTWIAQELRLGLSQTLRTGVAQDVLPPGADHHLLKWLGGQLVTGPNVQDVEHAGENAAIAVAAAAAAAAAMAAAAAIANGAAGQEVYSFVGDGVTTVFTLPFKGDFAPNQLRIDFDGILQKRSSWTIANTTLTFAAPPRLGEVVDVMSRLALAAEAATAQLMVLNDGRSVQSAVDAFDTAGRVYGSKALAQSAMILPQQIRLMVRQGNVTVSYYRDATGDLTTADGAIWKREEGPISRSMFSSDGDFDTAATALGFEFPTPYMTRFDLPPQQIGIFALGVKPSNLLADAADNVLAIQDAINWLNSKTNGGRINGGSFHPGHTNPIVALRKASGQPYGLMLKPKVTLDMRGVRFRAAEAMETMVETTVDPTVDAATGRLRNVGIYGGFWDAGRLADHVFRIREFEDIHVGHGGMILQSALRSPVRLGDPTRSKNSYGIYADSFKVANANSAYGGAAVAAIESVHGFSDSHFNHLLLEGYPKGITGEIYISRMMDCHAWSFADTQGPLQVGFDCSGGQNVYWGMQVDNPYEAAFKISGGDNYRFIGCTSTMDLSDVVDPGKPASGTIPVFKVDPALPTSTTVVIIGGFGNDRAATTFARMASFPTGTDVTVRASYLRYGAVNQEIERGFRRTAAKITTAAGVNPTINASQNIASVTRNADADYTFTMTNGQPTADYLIKCHVLPTSYPQALKWLVRDQQASSFRLQFVDSAGAFIRPATITVATEKV